MEITKNRLAQIIEEEYRKILLEAASELDKTVTVPPQLSPTLSVPTKPFGGEVAKLVLNKETTIHSFDQRVIDDVLRRYSKANDLELKSLLGQGAFGKVYLVDGINDEEVIKVTVQAEEYNSYKNIQFNKKKIEGTDEEAAKALPEVYDTKQLVSMPVILNPRDLLIPSDDRNVGKTFRFFVIRMEKLKPLDQEIEADLFGPDHLSDETAGNRYVENLISFDNFFESLEKVLGEETFEALLSTDREMPLGHGKSVFFEIEKRIGQIKQSLKVRKLGPVTLRDALQELSNFFLTIVTKRLGKELAKSIKMYIYKFLHEQMLANVKIPQYDPERIKKSFSHRFIAPTSDLKSVVAKNFFNRLKRLEKFDIQYGDVHRDNVMLNQDGDLVVADVGLFLYGSEGDRQWASSSID
jgi:serine/threonine protein kinase